jgi:phosphoribosylglycinamide formyltransferase-1
MKKIVILISGRGSNMRAIVDACISQKWPAQIAAVISNKADASGLAYAAELGIDTAVVVSKEFSSREAFDHCSRRLTNIRLILLFWRVLCGFSHLHS